ncbi:cytochrome P450, partial [Cantharellus anzutake]|uniref:cytochrome P450 n=1 Tax=Cantharellus anzutake TaxID=1750568 RepID=UPI00190367AA
LGVYVVYNWCLHPLSSVPGPLVARLGFPFWFSWQAWKRNCGPALKALHDLYGDTVRVGPNSVSTIDLDAVRTIYAHGSQYKKSNIYSAYRKQGPVPNIFSQRDVSIHNEQRRELAPVFNKASIVKLEEYIEPCITMLTDQLDRILQQTPRPTSPVNLSSWLHFFTMDAIGEIAFGQDFSLLRDGTDTNGLLAGTATGLRLTSIASTLPWPYPFSSMPKSLLFMLMSLFAKHSSLVVFKKSAEIVYKRYNPAQNITHRKEEVREDMIGQFMKLRYKSTGEKWSRDHVQIETLNLMAAGPDSTAAALSVFFHNILTSPRVYDQLQAEIDTAVEDGLQFPVTYAQASKLEYLQACVKESLRVLPITGMILDRVVPEASDGLIVKIGKSSYDSPSERMVRLPEGINVGACPFVFQRSKSIFGEDAEVFRPERWLEASPEELTALERWIITWGLGSRTCLGKGIAEMAISKVLPTLLWRY